MGTQKIDIKKMKEEMLLKKKAAQGKIEAAKEEATIRKKTRKTPPPIMYNIPKQTGDHEIDSLADLDELSKGFRERMKMENHRFLHSTDSEFWACLCFETREQKEAFLTAIDVICYGDKYIDGKKVAEKLKINLPKSDITYNISDKVDKTWIQFT